MSVRYSKSILGPLSLDRWLSGAAPAGWDKICVDAKEWWLSHKVTVSVPVRLPLRSDSLSPWLLMNPRLTSLNSARLAFLHSWTAVTGHWFISSGGKKQLTANHCNNTHFFPAITIKRNTAITEKCIRSITCKRIQLCIISHSAKTNGEKKWSSFF